MGWLACSWPMCCACAGAAADSGGAGQVHRHEVSGAIALYADDYRVRGYDEDDPRLQRVLRDLEQVYGRPIAVRFHVEMMPRDQGFFEHFFDEELGKLPRTMARWKKSHPEAFGEMMAELRHIDFDYDGSLSEASSAYGEEPGRLHIVLNGSELDDELVNGVMFHAHRRWLVQRFVSQDPSTLPPSEHLAYLEALRSAGRAHFAAQEDAADDQREPEPGRSAVILRTLELEQIASSADRPLRAELLKRLLEDGRYLHDCYTSHQAFVDRVASPSVFLDAERKWTGWAMAQLHQPDFALRVDVLELLIVRGRTEPRLVPDPRAFPTFDVVQVGMRMLKEWSAEGHPTAAGRAQHEDSKARYFDRLVCASAPTDRGMRTNRGRSCRPNLYAAALANPKATQQLLSLAKRTDDVDLWREITLNVMQLTGSRWGSRELPAVATVLELWRSLENSPRFVSMARLMAQEIDVSTDLREALYDQSTRYYRTRPRDRGVLLFLLARIDGYGRTQVNWERFAEIYGAEIMPAHFATYLQQGPLAFEEMHQLWPALGHGWSVSDVVVPQLHEYLDAKAPERESASRANIVRRIGDNIARHDSLSGLQKLHNTLSAYVKDDPSRERWLRDALSSIQSDIERLQRNKKTP